MGKSNSAVEEILVQTDCPASSSKSIVPLVQIDSIYIDISCPMEETERPFHEHFSIRGFVAGVRKKNSTAFSPFALEGDSDGSLNDLTPLSVPKFRWWQCSHCIPEIATEKNGPEMVTENQHDIAGTSSPQTLGCGKGRLLLLNKETTGNKDKKIVKNTEVGDLYGNIAFRSQEQHENGAEYPSTRADNGSSESSGGFIPLPNRRKQKLRSLADIMEEEKNSASGHLMTGSASSNGTHITSRITEPDARIDNRNPYRKKKAVPEDRQETVETNFRPAKRLKPHVPEAVKTSKKRVQISDSEAETVASRRLELQVSARTKRVKHKNKILPSSRMQRQADNENRTAQTQNASELNAAKNCSFAWTAPDGSTLRGDDVPLFNGNTESSNSKFADVPVQNSLWKAAANANNMGHCNIKEKVTLDLSLSSYSDAERKLSSEKSFVELRGIPDLNESIIERTPTVQESQLPAALETRSLSHERTLGESSNGREANAIQGKRHSDASQLCAIQSRDDNHNNNNVELGGTSDDIPMEIVELLAKNQQERALENSRQHFPPNGPPALYGMTNFPFPSTANSASSADRFGQGVLAFPYFQPETCNPGAGFRLFSSLVQMQQCNSGSGYFGSNPLRTNERADLLWHPRRKNLPFNVSVGQNYLVPHNGFLLHTSSDQCCKGKNICPMNSTEKGDLHDASGVNEGRIIPCGPSSVGFSDAYSNVDNIPAMQLLSLTNQGNLSGSPFQLGYSSFHDKASSSPCIQHPNLNPLIPSPLLSLSKEIPHFRNGESFSRSHLQTQMPAHQGRYRDAESDEGRYPKQPPTTPDDPRLCVLNRNPADFTIIDASNEYIISAKDLKFKKRNAASKSKQRLPPDAPKRKWVRRNSTRDQAAATQHKIKNARKNMPKKSGRQENIEGH